MLQLAKCHVYIAGSVCKAVIVCVVYAIYSMKPMVKLQVPTLALSKVDHIHGQLLATVVT